MPQMRERSLVLEMRRNHLWLDGPFVAMRRSAFAIFVVIVVAAIKVVWTFMFVRATVLSSTLII